MKYVSDGRKNSWVNIDESEDKEKIKNYFPQLIQTFCKMHHFDYKKPQEIRNKLVGQITNNPFFNELLSTPLGAQSVFYAIKKKLTLVVPLNPPPLSVEFLASHMIYRQGGKKDFVSINGIYGKIESEGLSPYSDQLIPFPMVIHPELISDRFLFDKMKPKITHISDGGASIIEGCSCETSIGFFPVLFISQTMRFEGCEWGYLSENVTKEWKLPMYCPVCIQEIDVNQMNIENIHEVTRKYKSNKSLPKQIFNDVKSRKEAEAKEKSRLQRIFKEDNVMWLYSNVKEEENEITQLIADSMKDETVTMYINATKTQFPDLVKGKSMEERARLLQRVVDGVKKKLPQPIQERFNNNLTESELGRKILENIFSSMLFEYIWPPCYDKFQTSKEVVNDMKLEQIIKIHQFIHASHLDVNFLDEPSGQKGIRQIIGILRKMNNFKTPSQKLMQLANAFKVLQSLTFSLLPPGDSVTADILLPSFIYIVIRANTTHLASTLSYLSAFSQRGDVNGEYSYYITNLYGAISFLLEINGNKLTIEQKIYDDAVTKMKKEISQQRNLFDIKRENGIALFERFKTAETFNEYDKIELLKKYQMIIKENALMKEEISKL
ncbi:vacuolar sorting protein 9 domain containing protein [Entamoeba histolytica HM-1:IMSS-B]|uniref:Vacuolar sorting protein 9 (VPS9) domain, putative n=6 Tax=Entamoeba histolytica TaxID=5759 RepID=C4M413_ENTH1|nr:Vacuolar sorting protein 9 (VPS9) domain, putative [Entamoeba histolytica HM-1:IMSS]EMD46291.1 RAB GDP/GTP exchange factor, putative [Entamoeba histolytica KU27]EMH75292.1 vacuolar sorting protein 9 domain containing protein [Entamoeba histolytica HM-1:IMSS-B]EMS12324.1 RAB GDP/GTP exchange factor, putative [Entamoeba histolytica HM-3:IMSS]ENY66056.1 RAB GDP/GTP exchange factor, putative [Entamoeba histolytica HM-1:IMSS-A]GAT96082.1 vacuolar sorting protein 9 vps9 domain containing protein |eukprot:XP_653868.1 Vacuolar sorting protein 9 (VPS9) domain, putative [Entamoeba histolytica HM-1:IMSS]